MNVVDINDYIVSVLASLWEQNKERLIAADPDFTFQEFCFEFWLEFS